MEAVLHCIAVFCPFSFKIVQKVLNQTTWQNNKHTKGFIASQYILVNSAGVNVIFALTLENVIIVLEVKMLIHPLECSWDKTGVCVQTLLLPQDYSHQEKSGMVFGLMGGK